MKMHENNERFYLKDYSSIDAKTWDSFVYNNSFGFTYYRYEYLKIDEVEMTENCSFLIIDKLTGKILVLCPLFIKKNDGGGIECVYCRNGVLINNEMGNSLKNKVGSYFISYINSILTTSIEKRIYSEIPALAMIEDRMNNPLLFYGFKPCIRYTWITNISDSPELFLSRCESSTRRDIKRIENESKYYIEEISDNKKESDNYYHEFYDLCHETYFRNGISAKSDEYYKNVFYNLDDSYRRIFYLRNRHNNKVMVLSVFFIYRDKAHYSIGASTTVKERGVSKLLIYKSLIELHKLGIKYVEMGGAYPYLPHGEKMRGISDFKKSFGCELYPMHMGEFVFRH